MVHMRRSHQPQQCLPQRQLPIIAHQPAGGCGGQLQMLSYY